MKHLVDVNKNIYLAGFMGVGKTMTARALSETLGWGFLDTDAAIEYLQRRSIATIFAQSGEGFFRSCENDMVCRLEDYQQTVVSLGGGTLHQPNHINILKQTGILIYLKASVETILQRIRQAMPTRPLLASTPESDLTNKVCRLLAIRESDYRLCDMTVSVDGMDIESVVDTIIQRLKEKADKDDEGDD